MEFIAKEIGAHKCRRAVEPVPNCSRRILEWSSTPCIFSLSRELGEAEKAMYHYKQAGAESDPDVLTKAKNLQVHLTGADSAPQIFALQAEALLKLHRLQEADEALTKGQNFDMDDCTQFFGSIGHASRFDDAVAAAQRAARLDSSSKEVNMVVRRTRAVAMARSNEPLAGPNLVNLRKQSRTGLLPLLCAHLTGKPD
ncbi:Inactive TPR repeat-containing thioredoxin TTL3 [Camellia lanceoleosa]|uniref:Inactive TPR repeat-containing thioredoxin TTL3 n=1 Tax=Camellia lanceoleosa TaxID=1840588 RepID=A0ACC0H890_9ERIC|nr:Inactive TPR repeat-containing thioredoxin TTL3 [Camellia lanceoleosa]